MEEMLEKINTDKEILSTMPKNNAKNREKYVEKLKETKIEYENYNESILKEIEKRYTSIIDASKDGQIDELKEKIDNINKNLYLLNDVKTAYEKTGIDKMIYKLNRFYKENLEIINNQILGCIKKFNEVGIVLTPDDFDYSEYVKDYMEYFYKKSKAENVNTDGIKKKFEEIYWKCPDIIIHIEINFRYLYLKHKNTIEKYFEKKRNDLLKSSEKKKEDFIEEYYELKKQLDFKKETDKYEIIKKFRNKELDAKDYTVDKIDAAYKKIIDPELIENADEQKIQEFNENIEKFLNTLYEYKNYLKFKFVLDDIKKKYEEKDKYKNAYATTKKEIDALEKKLKKLSNTSGLFKKKAETPSAEYTNCILEIRAKYRELEDNKVNEKIANGIKDNSTIFDVLYFANSFSCYMFNCMIENIPNITPEEMEIMTQELEEFIKSPYSTMMNNITILDNKDLQLIIKDRYKLLDFNITKEDVEEDNLDNMINILNTIKTSNNIRKSGLDISKLNDMFEFEKILKVKE